MAITPVEPTPPPAGPLRGDRITFSGRVDAFITWLGNAPEQLYALAVGAFSNAQASEAAAAVSTTAANSTAGSSEAAAESASVAAIGANTAMVAAAEADASRVASVAARDTAQLSAGVYASAAVGLAATESGKFFSVPAEPDGTLLSVYLNNAGTAEFQREVQQPRTVSKRSGVLFGLAGQGGKMPWYVDLAGNMWSMGINVTSLLGWILPSKTLSMWGDSMTMYLANSAVFQAAFAGRAVRGFGIGGQTSEQVFARQGSFPILITLPGNAVASTTAATHVDAFSVAPLSTVADAIVRSMKGTLGGVPGSLTRAADDTYTFSRATPGPAAAIDAQTPFIPESHYCRETTTFWPGRNDIYQDVPLAVIQGLISNAVNHLQSADWHFLLLSCMNAATEYATNTTPTGKANYPTEAARYQAVVALNLWMKRTWPANYVEVRRALIRQYNPAVAQDVIDFGRDVVPASLRMDDVHLSTAGNTMVTAVLASEFKTRGW